MGMNQYSHRLDDPSAMIDGLLLRGVTEEEAMTKLREKWCNVREDKVLRHVY